MRSSRPSRCRKLNTELTALPRLAGKAPLKKSTSLMKFTLIIPTGPPEAPWVAKWLMLGTSTSSRKKRFSLGAPPRMIRSLRNAGVMVTPGRVCTTLEMSRLPPGFRWISATPMVRRDTGLSSVFLKGGAFITTSSSFWELLSRARSMLAGLLLLTWISNVLASS